MKSKIVCTIILLVAPFVSAQQKDSAKISTKVDLVSIGEDIPGLSLGKGKKTISALAFRYGKTIRYKGDRVIEISQSSSAKNAQPEEEDHPDALIPLPPQKIPSTEVDQKDNIAKAIEKRRKKNPDLVALAVVPSGSRHITILLTPAANSTYRAYVVNDDPTKLPYGKMRVHNFCKHPISMRFNNRKAQIIPSQKGRQESPNASNTLSYFLGYPKNKTWKIQENNILRVTKDEQVQMIIMRSRSSFFVSASGARGGRMQVAVLRRNKSLKKLKPDDPAENDRRPALPEGKES